MTDHLPLNLSELTGRIQDEYDAMDRAGQSMLQHAINIGSMLAQSKPGIGHGKWEQWVEDNFSFRPRQARKYMRLAEHSTMLLSKRTCNADLGIDEALKLIADESPKPAPRPPAPPAPAPVIDIEAERVESRRQPQPRFADDDGCSGIPTRAESVPAIDDRSDETIPTVTFVGRPAAAPVPAPEPVATVEPEPESAPAPWALDAGKARVRRAVKAELDAAPDYARRDFCWFVKQFGDLVWATRQGGVPAADAPELLAACDALLEKIAHVGGIEPERRALIAAMRAAGAQD
jgi:hypothetical protein